MTTERENSLNDIALQQFLRGLSELRRIEEERGKPEKTGETLFKRAISSGLSEIREESRIKPL